MGVKGIIQCFALIAVLFLGYFMFTDPSSKTTLGYPLVKWAIVGQGFSCIAKKISSG